MTYYQLVKKLLNLPIEQLHMDAVICVYENTDDEEFFDVRTIATFIERMGIEKPF